MVCMYDCMYLYIGDGLEMIHLYTCVRHDDLHDVMMMVSVHKENELCGPLIHSDPSNEEDLVNH